MLNCILDYISNYFGEALWDRHHVFIVEMLKNLAEVNRILNSTEEE